MKKFYITFLFLTLLFSLSPRLSSQTIWNGEKITFTKTPYTDWNLPENQDRIMEDIWITRGNSLPIFNVAEEDYDLWGSSPADTKWAFGSIADGVETLLFDSWGHAIGWNPPSTVGKNMVLYLVSDNIYIDIKFTSWTSGQGTGGGGFSYERSTGTMSESLWTGPVITFTKANNADWTVADNQDRITDNVWITRADDQGLFNIAQEEWFSEGSFGTVTEGSPWDTEWAFGAIADGVETLTFDYWGNAIGWYPPGMVGENMVLHLISEDIYIDVKFTSWTSGEGEGGGGFSYERSTGTMSETLWTGNAITFTKANNADWTLPENQDRITDNVWISRGDTEGIFNLVHEFAFMARYISSPTKTKWAFGTTDDGVENLDFYYFLLTIGYRPPDMINQDMVLLLVPYDIYIDIKFTSWSSGEEGGGGGFSYIRSTAPSTAVEPSTVPNEKITLYPNPASDFVYIKVPNGAASYMLDMYDILGQKVESRLMKGNEPISVGHLEKGLYLYVIDQNGTKHRGSLIIGK
jgi:hypothetical protein